MNWLSEHLFLINITNGKFCKFLNLKNEFEKE